ncbi:MAG: methyltransferase [Sneathiella sp.]|jgi:tRNA (cmo5U34)-methyltransferase|uniref:class I SAM-dependent methyltransferase n=1 Tax=Sneathiella sp. TaxID=1964365 RepID=UPI000C470C0F|nr:class I SAM-dependent methyltransferase [Sneathiella sp.]MAL79644.1 methyltransferase [Sneathiella sp.]|tara:strand:+ start:95 stop:802 length:708 start_codon:yes stop_codon:yes gene_type:complete
MTEKTTPGPQQFLDHFENPEAVASYADGPRRFVPGLVALHRMTSILLAETVGEEAQVLILGAGGGLELKALADDHPNWRFTGVDPAAAMLDQATKTAALHMDRITLVKGYIDDAPNGPFDGATCLLTLHFLEREERVSTLRAIRNRLRPGAPFVAAHSSFPQGRGERDNWLNRYAAYAIASGVDARMAMNGRNAVAASLSLYEPAEEIEMLHEAGFKNTSSFFSAFTWHGWIAYA